jgi:ATP-dependent Clp protease adaptor protein ClpS
MEVCEHTYEQASQCTVITHYKGKCEVKKGGFKTLKPLKDALIERKLNATID